jgi:integrase
VSGASARRCSYLGQMPEIETPGKRVLGHSARSARKQAFLVFTAKEVAAIIAKLPEAATSKRSGGTFPVRARFVVAWETSLRPATLDKLTMPENYRRGSSFLAITDEADKSRFRRELPLSDAARAALDSVCPAAGLIFGAHDFRTLLRAAAEAAGIDEYRAKRISDYDFRHSRLTHLGQVTPATCVRRRLPQKMSSRPRRRPRRTNCGYILVSPTIAQSSYRVALAQKAEPRTARHDSGSRRSCEEGDSNPHGS